MKTVFFNKIACLAIFSIVFFSCSRQEKNALMITFDTPPRPAGQSDVIGLACEPIDTVRVGFIGLGMRGFEAVKRFMYLEAVEVKAFCDIEPERVELSQSILIKNNREPAATYSNEDSWKDVCERDDIDLIYISTDWLNHAKMAVYAMEQGKHVALEVPATVTVSECWQLVNTAEKTRKHCMMLENCCYDFFELATLNMAQQGVFGEIVHVEGAYIHDLRELNFNSRYENESFIPGATVEKKKEAGLAGYWNSWRLRYNAEHNGNPYPTHGLGPVCQILNIHRGDKMDYLVSMSTNQFGMTEYAEKRFGKESREAKQEYKMGDMNTTLIRTNKGKTILIQHDVTSPRPYDRKHLISGTKGFAQKYPSPAIALEPNAHSFLDKNDFDALMTEYEHPFSKEIGDLAKKVGGHGGMDFIMDYRLIYCLQNGLPLDQDVYDAAAWSCLVELTEISVNNAGRTVKIPDFTRGAWKKLDKLTFFVK